MRRLQGRHRSHCRVGPGNFTPSPSQIPYLKDGHRLDSGFAAERRPGMTNTDYNNAAMMASRSASSAPEAAGLPAWRYQ